MANKKIIGIVLILMAIVVIGCQTSGGSRNSTGVEEGGATKEGYYRSSDNSIILLLKKEGSWSLTYMDANEQSLNTVGVSMERGPQALILDDNNMLELTGSNTVTLRNKTYTFYKAF